MKTIYLSLSLLLAFGATTSIANPVAMMQTADIQCKLLNDTKVTFVYYVNGTKYEMLPNTAKGLSFPANTSIKIIDAKTKKEKEILKLTTAINGKSYLVSTIKK
ncbi:MAG: hypothetical protein WCP57_01850 [Bacteroidota bacterium]